MAVRIKSKWFGKAREKPSHELLKENASALAFIIWRLALDKAINLHGEDFIYDDDVQRIKVIGEYLAMLVQVVDRMAYTRFDDEDRAVLITELAMKLGEHMQDNGVEILGPADYKGPFIDMLNRRSAGYAEFDFSPEDGPSYSFLQYFGAMVQNVMGEKHHANKWVIDQVMDIDGPEVIERVQKAMRDLFAEE